MLCEPVKATRPEKQPFVITEHSSDAAAGIWISRRGESTPCVAICMDHDRPMVGVFGPMGNAMAAAISIDPSGEGMIQLLTQGGEAVFLSATDLVKLKKLIADR